MKKVYLKMYLKKNLGDDLFLKIILERYPFSKFMVNSKKIYNNILNTNNIKYYNTFFCRAINFIGKKIKCRNLLTDYKLSKKSNFKIVLGGSMFVENESCNTDAFEDKITKEYNLCNKPYYILGSNFGPYNSNEFYEIYKEVFKNAKDVCFREKYSYDLFKDLKNVRYNSDIVFSMNCDKYKKENNNTVVISIINLENRNKLKDYLKRYEEYIINLTSSFVEKGKKVIFMSFCEFEGDELAINRIYDNLDSNIKEFVSKYFYDGNIDEALNIIVKSDTVVGTRFHATILGILFEKKVLPIIYSDKTLNVLNDMNFNGKIIKMSELDETIDVDSIAKYSGDLNKLIESSNKQFEILDKELNK